MTHMDAAAELIARYIRREDGAAAARDADHQRRLGAAARRRELLAFRHFLRHAYAVASSPERLAANPRLLVDTHPRLVADLLRFEGGVRLPIAAAGG